MFGVRISDAHGTRPRHPSTVDRQRPLRTSTGHLIYSTSYYITMPVFCCSLSLFLSVSSSSSSSSSSFLPERCCFLFSFILSSSDPLGRQKKKKRKKKKKERKKSLHPFGGSPVASLSLIFAFRFGFFVFFFLPFFRCRSMAIKSNGLYPLPPPHP